MRITERLHKTGKVMFEVGKKVIALDNHSQGIYRKGEVFTLNAIKKARCNCKRFLLDIGVKSRYGHSTCPTCGSTCIADDIWWFGSNHFAPYDDSLSDITAEELIERLELQTA